MKVHSFTKLVSGGKSLITERLTENHFYKYLHRHDEWQLTWIEEGQGTLIAGNDMHEFVPGDVFLIGANLPHLLKNNAEYYAKTSKNRVKSCSIYFNPEGLLKPLFSFPEVSSFKDFLKINKHGFKVPAQYADLIKQSMLDMHSANGIGVFQHFLILMQHFLSINCEIVSICSPVFTSKISEVEGVRLSKIIKYIVENYHEHITLDDVAKKAFMTPQAFCRYFKKHTGHTFITFLNEVRINDACKILKDVKTQRSMIDIAYSSGFNSITNFNRVFKSVTGKSPKAYTDTLIKGNKLLAS